MATLTDGLGGEERAISGLGFSGAPTASEFVPGSLTTLDQISGANIYSTADVIGESVYGDTVVSGALLKATTGSIDTIHSTLGTLRSAMVGSAYGMRVMAGSNVLSSNTAWVEFPGSFASNTGSQIIVITSNTQDPAEGLSASNISLGSFMASGTNAADTFNWIAVGI